MNQETHGLLSTAGARELLIQSIRIPSVSGQERPVAEYLRGWMSNHGFTAHIDAAGNAVGERGSGPLTVVLLGHIDTVPGEIEVRVDEDQVLHGRGSVDAKGSFCTFVAAVAGLDAQTLERARFVCIGATEEEVPSSKGAHFAAQQYRPDAVVIGEPSGWEGLTLGYKGRLVLHVHIEKPNFHTAGEGRSAGDDLTESWFRVRAWAQERSANAPGAGIFAGVQATVQHIESQTDGLTQRASGVFGLRLPPDLSPDQARAELTERLVGLAIPAQLSEFRYERTALSSLHSPNSSTHSLPPVLLGEDSAAKVQVGRDGPPSFSVNQPVLAPEGGDACPLLGQNSAAGDACPLGQNGKAILTNVFAFSGDEAAVKHPKDSPLARALRLAIRDAGGTPVFKLKTGTSDMNVVAPHWPVPTLAYGPGDSRLDHTPEERLYLSEYDLAVTVLRDALTRLAQSLKPPQP